MVKVPLSKKYRLRITYFCVVDGLRIHNLCRYCLKTSTTSVGVFQGCDLLKYTCMIDLNLLFIFYPEIKYPLGCLRSVYCT